ncbi:MAG: type II toxin-antitoxin system RelB/DinJ family antitoxin [Raoultibacter sp.]
MPTATLNVRMSQDLKSSGDKVLAASGVSVSEAVRSLYEYLDREQKIPDFFTEGRPTPRQELFEKRREAVGSMVGILPPDVDFDAAKQERLLHKCRPGVRA